mmetsp:Transcript_129298/g.192583  ORF Transcript_129298/g.192583 Transcript_129298/m.192583 type:complete len:196 (+) Transcript_129298:16-603(+)
MRASKQSSKCHPHNLTRNMTIPREIEGLFIVLDDRQPRSEQQGNGPLIGAEEAAVLEMLEEIDELWGCDNNSFCPSSDGSSVNSDEIDDNDDSDDERIMLDIDFPRSTRTRTERRPTRSRLQQLQREVAEERRRYGLDNIDEENTNDDDSVVLHTRRGVRRHSQRRVEEFEEESLRGSFCSTRSDDASSRVPTKI